LTASEFAFLALGLVLGVASGAALIEVLRARPPAAREVRVTVAPNAIHARFAATLAVPSTSLEAAGPATGGPGDRRWHDEPPSGDLDPTFRRAADRAATPTRISPIEPVPEAGPATRSGTGVPTRPSRVRAAGPTSSPGPGPLRFAPAGGAALVPVPMSIEPDPLTAALRSTAAAVATAAMVLPHGRPEKPSILDRAMASAGPTGGDPGKRSRTAAAPSSPPSGAGAGGSSRASASPPPPAAPASPPAQSGPCAEARRVAEERCAVATRARAGATAAADALRTAQRTHDEHVAAAEAAAAAADPRAIRAAKEEAQQRFRDSRAAATSRDDVEGAARTWLTEINRINQETREAASRVERSQAAANSLALSLERLAVEADAARISAEQADESCVAAREVVAACDEAQALEAAAAALARPVPPPSRRATPAPIAAPAPPAADEFGDVAPGSRAGHEALILRILRGDRAAMQHAVARLAGEEADGGRHWQARLSGLAEALIARSIEASAFDFPPEHFFWGAFDLEQNRDIMAALSSLGYRFDGFGGWVDDRIPGQRDLSLATGYAGLDPMRVRHWPNEAEMKELLADVRVAADEYVSSAAGGLTLGELITLLGRRADGLTDLWNDWGTVRLVLLEGG
jgi:hypothetical protein